MGGEDYLFWRCQQYATTGTIDVDEIRGWLGPHVVGGWQLTPNQEWMRVCALYCAGVTNPDPLRDPRTQLLAYLRTQAVHGHQWLGPRTDKGGVGEGGWRIWQASMFREGRWVGPWPGEGLRDSWSEQDSGIYENFWVVPTAAAYRRAAEDGDLDVLGALTVWFGHHAARLSAVPLPASAGHPVGTPGARSSEPCMGPRSMAYHLLVEPQPEERVRYWRGDNRAKELEAAVLGCGIGRVTPRLDYVLRHPVQVWRGDGWSWQTCEGLPGTKPGPVSTVVVGQQKPVGLRGGEADNDAPGVWWSRDAVTMPGEPHEIQGLDPSAPVVKPPAKPPEPPAPPAPPKPPKEEPKEPPPLFVWQPPHAFEQLRGAQCRLCYRGRAAHPILEPVPARAPGDTGKQPPSEWGVTGAGNPRRTRPGKGRPPRRGTDGSKRGGR